MRDATWYGKIAANRAREQLVAENRDQAVVELLRAAGSTDPDGAVASLLGRRSNPQAPVLDPATGATWVVRAAWPHPDVAPFTPPAAHKATAQHAARVRVNHGRWVVDCPCGGAQLACRTDHRMFCVDCLNEHVAGAWVPVVWPANVEQIEGILGVRPVDLQNWDPIESVEQLRAENRILADQGTIA